MFFADLHVWLNDDVKESLPKEWPKPSYKTSCKGNLHKCCAECISHVFTLATHHMWHWTGLWFSISWCSHVAYNVYRYDRYFLRGVHSLFFKGPESWPLHPTYPTILYIVIEKPNKDSKKQADPVWTQRRLILIWSQHSRHILHELRIGVRGFGRFGRELGHWSASEYHTGVSRNPESGTPTIHTI